MRKNDKGAASLLFTCNKIMFSWDEAHIKLLTIGALEENTNNDLILVFFGQHHIMSNAQAIIVYSDPEKRVRT